MQPDIPQAKSERGGRRHAAICRRAIPRIVHEENLMHFETDRSETSRGRALASEHLLDAHAKTIVQRLLELAENGDPTALRLCLERMSPPLRERPLQFALPPLATPADAVAAIAAITAGLADGALSAAEGLDLARMVRMFVETLVLARRSEQDTERRLTDLPAQERCDGEVQLRRVA
jgi:hypothetical protein